VAAETMGCIPIDGRDVVQPEAVETIGTLRTGYPHVQASSQDNGSRLSAVGSSGTATCPTAPAPASRLGAASGPPHVPAALAPAPDSGQL
jgi:hypothetical protein